MESCEQSGHKGGLQSLVQKNWFFQHGSLPPPTPVQGLSPNSTAINLLVGFAQGNVQMQRNAIKHFQQGNLPRLQNITIELLEPGTGRVIGSILDVNFMEGLDQMATKEMIGEMLNQIDPTYNESRESNTSNKIGVDHNHCSMG